MGQDPSGLPFQPFRALPLYVNPSYVHHLFLHLQTGKTDDMVVKIALLVMAMVITVYGGDTNSVYDPCSDTKVLKGDGFTFGLAFTGKEKFFFNQTQLSPCDSRLPLSPQAELALFRPKVDEISLLTINTINGSFDPAKLGGYMVAFAGRQYAARSLPVFVADATHIVTSFTLVLEFQKGTLQNVFFKKFGCASCSGDFVCLNQTDCAVPISKCTSSNGPVDCGLSIQLAFSGTDRSDSVLNSWYEVANLRQYSLYALFNDLRGSITSPFSNLF